ncbi:hypothetical protein BJ742DRAFT_814125 [Cladochytrium replicatum]|nr:hypothetical protein BJ742DRAFT_814125 [Cladochytrium replicatum]
MPLKISRTSEKNTHPLAERIYERYPEARGIHVNFESELSSVGDPLADECLDTFWDPEKGYTAPDGDVVAALLKEHEATEGKMTHPARKAFMDQVMAVPEWVNPEQIIAGQRTFWTYAEPMVLSLGYAVLAGGFSSPTLSRTLSYTGHLSSGTPERVGVRLLETTQFVLDVCGGVESIMPRGQGWMTSLRVRFLHASVRRKVHAFNRNRQNKGELNDAVLEKYQLNDNYVPINQGEMAMTILGFYAAPILGLRHMFLNPTTEQEKGYGHLWGYISYLMGVLPENDPVNVPGGIIQSQGMHASYISQYCAPDTYIIDSSRRKPSDDELAIVKSQPRKIATFSTPTTDFHGPGRLTISVLRALSFTMRHPLGIDLSFTRFALGEQVAERLAIPRPPLWAKVYVLSMVAAIILFSKVMFRWLGPYIWLIRFRKITDEEKRKGLGPNRTLADILTLRKSRRMTKMVEDRLVRMGAPARTMYRIR